MIARARVALNAAHLTSAEIAAGALERCERTEITGTRIEPTGDTWADWEAAKAACPIPEDAKILHWWRHDLENVS
jgi:hypothetical protein